MKQWLKSRLVASEACSTAAILFYSPSSCSLSRDDFLIFSEPVSSSFSIYALILVEHLLQLLYEEEFMDGNFLSLSMAKMSLSYSHFWLIDLMLKIEINFLFKLSRHYVPIFHLPILLLRISNVILFLIFSVKPSSLCFSSLEACAMFFLSSVFWNFTFLPPEMRCHKFPHLLEVLWCKLGGFLTFLLPAQESAFMGMLFGFT